MTESGWELKKSGFKRAKRWKKWLRKEIKREAVRDPT